MLWRKKKAEVARDDQPVVQKVDIENWSEDEKHDFYSAVSDYSQMDLYTGFVEHAYAMDTVATPACCPRCQAATQQQYANFIYATQRAPRVMFAPAGYFCTVCPSVVIDEALIRQGVRRPFTYQGVLGIDHKDKNRPDLFKTWNGSRTSYVFDEDQNPIGLTTTAGLPSKGSTKSQRQSDRRKQMAKASRRQNRRTPFRDRTGPSAVSTAQAAPDPVDLMIDIAEKGGPVEARRLGLLPDGSVPVKHLQNALVLDHKGAVGEVRRQTDDQRPDHIAAAWGVFVGHEVTIPRVDIESIEFRSERGRIVRQQFPAHVFENARSSGIKVEHGKGIALGLELEGVSSVTHFGREV